MAFSEHNKIANSALPDIQHKFTKAFFTLQTLYGTFYDVLSDILVLCWIAQLQHIMVAITGFNVILIKF
jgi:hypothetical protein